MFDNCPNDPNFDMFDADQDGIGNACDADFDQDGVVAGSDFSLLLSSFGLGVDDADYRGELDHDLDNVVAGSDFSFVLSRFGQAIPVPHHVPFEDTEVGDLFVVAVTSDAWADTGLGMIRQGMPITDVVRDTAGQVIEVRTDTGAGVIVESATRWVIDGAPHPDAFPVSCPEVSVMNPAYFTDNAVHGCDASVASMGISILPSWAWDLLLDQG